MRTSTQPPDRMTTTTTDGRMVVAMVRSRRNNYVTPPPTSTQKRSRLAGFCVFSLSFSAPPPPPHHVHPSTIPVQCDKRTTLDSCCLLTLLLKRLHAINTYLTQTGMKKVPHRRNRNENESETESETTVHAGKKVGAHPNAIPTPSSVTSPGPEPSSVEGLLGLELEVIKV